MKRVTWRSFAMGFGKEWLAPKVGTGFAVWLLTKVLLEQSDQKAVADALVKIIESAGDPHKFQLLLFCGALLIASIGLRCAALGWRSAKFLFRYARWVSVLASALNFLIGTLTVPLAIVLTSIFTGEVAWYETKDWQVWLVVAVSYVVCGAALYWIAEDDKNDGGAAAFWLIKLPHTVTGDAVVDLLTQHFKNFNDLCNVSEISNSSDGNALFELTIVYPIKKWSDKDVTDFQNLLADSTKLIRGKFTEAKVLHRFNSPEVVEHLKKLKKK